MRCEIKRNTTCAARRGRRRFSRLCKMQIKSKRNSSQWHDTMARTWCQHTHTRTPLGTIYTPHQPTGRKAEGREVFQQRQREELKTVVVVTRALCHGSLQSDPRYAQDKNSALSTMVVPMVNGQCFGKWVFLGSLHSVSPVP